MAKIIATVESVAQAKKVLEAGVDAIQFGEDYFGLRLKRSFTRDEQKELVDLAHAYGKEADVLVNAIFHNDRINQVEEYLRFLTSIGVDSIVVGDPGVVQVLKRLEQKPAMRYDMQVMVTNARQINFWANRGATSAVVAREVPRDELKALVQGANVPIEVLVYGPTAIHQSKRPLLENYFNYVQKEEGRSRERDLFISEPMKDDTHYSIYEDINGTHIFASNDINLVMELEELNQMGVGIWKIDGLFSEEEPYTEIVAIITRLREAISNGQFNREMATIAYQKLSQLKRKNREFDTGFYYKDPKEIQ
ncbi:peptidase U32 family protein [Atopobacter phocae]|uniref:peptidase U32 family protein n=1 Tax=Atopobacter phocae TaxID=136492 RepID=UPI00046FB196|nr:peptidase U32 family protein [Atopobacter phocae]